MEGKPVENYEFLNHIFSIGQMASQMGGFIGMLQSKK